MKPAESWLYDSFKTWKRCINCETFDNNHVSNISDYWLVFGPVCIKEKKIALMWIFSLSVFQSSLDRGCFSCECLLISENQEGLQFWRRRVGSEKIDRLLEDQQNTRQELFIELSKKEMSTFYQQTDLPPDQQNQHSIWLYHNISDFTMKYSNLWSQTVS